MGVGIRLSFCMICRAIRAAWLYFPCLYSWAMVFTRLGWNTVLTMMTMAAMIIIPSTTRGMYTMDYPESCNKRSGFRINEYAKACQIRRGSIIGRLRRLVFYPLLILLMVFPVFAQDSGLYESGVSAFMNNNPMEAAAVFETVVAQGNTDPDTFLYLAYSYEQLEMYEQGITALQKGMAYARDRRHLFYFNLGNLYLKQGDSQAAIQQYSLAISSRGSFADAYLNRGNSYLREWELDSALSDYQNFIRVAPEHALVPDVKRMIAAIQAEVTAEAERAIEEARQAELEAERQRLAELEAQRRAEEEAARRQALLDDILGNLDQASEEAKTLGAGTEQISDEEDDFERAD
jgi:tetratricopeptide (TPR) repeat protein